MKHLQRFRILGLGLFAVILLAACTAVNTNSTSNPNTNVANQNVNGTVSNTNTSAASYLYPGQEGKNALELLKAKYPNTTTKTSTAGEYVTGIDGKEAGATEYWQFLVNGTEAPVGAGAYKTKATDTIEWKLVSF
ncbi:MAG: DUF4430 domain-containing protein [Patescibacteria group bacterium]|jgi:hypothetical protein